MSVKRDDAPPQWSRLALAAAEELVGLNLLAADMVLDEARRLAHMRQFAGITIDKAQEILKAPDAAAVRIAMRIADRSLVEVLAIIDEARTFIWMGNFARIPSSAFGQQLAAFQERQQDPDRPLN